MRSIPPVITINSGETDSFLVPWRLKWTNYERLHRCDLDILPARPSQWTCGDTLQGWTRLIPGFGLLSDEFPEPALKIWQLNRDEGYAWFHEARGIKISLNSFAREMGIAPCKSGGFSAVLLYNTGGNLVRLGDIWQLGRHSVNKLSCLLNSRGTLFFIGVS